jgi:hypothetical protein
MLETKMRAYIKEHPTEFVPEGVDAAAVEAEEPVSTPCPTPTGSAANGEDPGRARERERNQRSLQWAYDTLEGAYKVAKQSTEGALDLLSDAWEQSSGSTVLYFVIIFLVVSNVWTLLKMGSREEVGRRKALRLAEEREQLSQRIVATLWEELAAARGVSQVGAPPPAALTSGGASKEWGSEVTEINKALDAIEARIKGLRQGLVDAEALKAVTHSSL